MTENKLSLSDIVKAAFDEAINGVEKSAVAKKSAEKPKEKDPNGANGKKEGEDGKPTQEDGKADAPMQVNQNTSIEDSATKSATETPVKTLVAESIKPIIDFEQLQKSIDTSNQLVKSIPSLTATIVSSALQEITKSINTPSAEDVAKSILKACDTRGLLGNSMAKATQSLDANNTDISQSSKAADEPSADDKKDEEKADAEKNVISEQSNTDLTRSDNDKASHEEKAVTPGHSTTDISQSSKSADDESNDSDDDEEDEEKKKAKKAADEDKDTEKGVKKDDDGDGDEDDTGMSATKKSAVVADESKTEEDKPVGKSVQAEGEATDEVKKSATEDSVHKDIFADVSADTVKSYAEALQANVIDIRKSIASRKGGYGYREQRELDGIFNNAVKSARAKNVDLYKSAYNDLVAFANRHN